MTTSNLKPLRYSIRETARLLNLSRSTIYSRLQEGSLLSQKDGRRRFISAEEIERYLRAPPSDREVR